MPMEDDGSTPRIDRLIEFFDAAPDDLSPDEKYLAWIAHAGPQPQRNLAMLEMHTLTLIGYGPFKGDPALTHEAQTIMDEQADARLEEERQQALAVAEKEAFTVSYLWRWARNLVRLTLWIAWFGIAGAAAGLVPAFLVGLVVSVVSIVGENVTDWTVWYSASDWIWWTTVAFVVTGAFVGVGWFFSQSSRDEVWPPRQ